MPIFEKNKTMKTILTLILSLASTITFAQNSTVLDFNNLGAILNTNGVFFNDQVTGTSGYTVPKDSGTAVIYASAFWFGGTDANNDLHLAATKFGLNDDVFCGPISTDYTHADYIDLYEDKFWKITKAEINDHYYHYQQPSYVMPAVIAEWPANGQSSLGVATVWHLM